MKSASRAGRSRIRRWAGRTSLALLAVFTVNLCIGKYRLLSGTGTAAPLDGVPEFLMLVVVVLLFVVAALFAESSSPPDKTE